MQSNALISTVSLVFKVTSSYIVKREKSLLTRMSVNPISCREATRVRMKPYREFSHQTAFAASVTSSTCLSTTCVWQRNFGKMTVTGVTSVVMRSLSSASVIALNTGDSETGHTVLSMMSEYSTASMLNFAGT